MLQDFKSVSDHFMTLRSKGLTTKAGLKKTFFAVTQLIQIL